MIDHVVIFLPEDPERLDAGNVISDFFFLLRTVQEQLDGEAARAILVHFTQDLIIAQSAALKPSRIQNFNGRREGLDPS